MKALDGPSHLTEIDLRGMSLMEPHCVIHVMRAAGTEPDEEGAAVLGSVLKQNPAITSFYANRMCCESLIRFCDDRVFVSHGHPEPICLQVLDSRVSRGASS